MLALGSTPTLELEDTDGNPVAIADHKGKDNVFIYFMRALSCAQCNAHVQTIIKHRADFDAANVEVIIAVPEDREHAAAWRERRKVPFPVVMGAAGTPHEEVGLMRKVFGAIQQSGGVLFDGDGVVRYTRVATNPGASYSAAELSEAIAALPAIG
ncbi:MAG: redoxin domain-containing protein [Galbitalea sp.]